MEGKVGIDGGNIDYRSASATITVAVAVVGGGVATSDDVVAKLTMSLLVMERGGWLFSRTGAMVCARLGDGDRYDDDEDLFVCM